MPGIDNRKDVLLLLLYLPGKAGFPSEPIRGRTRLMKLLFLLGQDKEVHDGLGIPNWYDFRSFDYGPFSNQVFDDIDFLRNVGLVETLKTGFQSIAETWEEEQVLEESVIGQEEPESTNYFEQEEFALSARGRNFVEQDILTDSKLSEEIVEEIKSLKMVEGALSLSSLLKYVYSKYPESAEESKLEHLRG